MQSQLLAEASPLPAQVPPILFLPLIMKTSSSPYSVILFDLGGVLVELAGVPRMMELTRHRFSMKELGEKWLTSPSIRAYESGSLSTEEFGKRIVAEFEMDIQPSRYLEEFTTWVENTYKGAVGLLESVKQHAVIASLSNINELHWKRVVEMNFIHLFDYNFPSHLTGRLKPDVETFLHASAEMGVRPDEVLFFDDNRLNVEGAKKAGMAAVEVHGVAEVQAHLASLGMV